MTKKIIETERLIMRAFAIDDVDDFTNICQNREVMRYIGNGDIPSKDEMSEKMTDWINQFEMNGYGLMVLLHKEDNKLIGFCGLIPQIIDGTNYIELGYRLDKHYWRQGLATEAALAVKDYAINSLKLTELISIIHHKNQASKNVAKKVGMTLATNTLYNGINVDIYKLSI